MLRTPGSSPQSGRRVARRVCVACGLLLLSSGTVADQNAPELPRLFEELGASESPAEANRLENRIWALWFEAPDEASGRLMDRLQSSMAEGDFASALDFAGQLVELAPDFAEGWNRRATILYLIGDYDASVADIRETLALESRHFGAISGLGLIFLRQGDAASALAAFEAVLEISPQSASARQSVERTRQELEDDI